MRTFETFPNLVTMFFTRANEKGDAPFLWAKRDGEWQATSWAEAARQVASLAAALRDAGLQPGDRVMLVSENRPEWCLSDLAIMAAGCITVPTYTTNTYHREFRRARCDRLQPEACRHGDARGGAHHPRRNRHRDRQAADASDRHHLPRLA